MFFIRYFFFVCSKITEVIIICYRHNIFFIKLINGVKEKIEKTKEEPVTESDPPAPTEAELLTEIRDLLKNK